MKRLRMCKKVGLAILMAIGLLGYDGCKQLGIYTISGTYAGYSTSTVSNYYITLTLGQEDINGNGSCSISGSDGRTYSGTYNDYYSTATGIGSFTMNLTSSASWSGTVGYEYNFYQSGDELYLTFISGGDDYLHIGSGFTLFRQ